MLTEDIVSAWLITIDDFLPLLFRKMFGNVFNGRETNLVRSIPTLMETIVICPI